MFGWLNISILKKKALFFLAKRDFAYNELFNKLKPYALNEDELHSVLSDLKNKGWLSEERYINNYISSKNKRYGILKIKNELYVKSGDRDLINELIIENNIDEVETAHQLWKNKFGDNVTTLDQKLIARGIRFLKYRGFNFDTINKVLQKIKYKTEEYDKWIGD